MQGTGEHVGQPSPVSWSATLEMGPPGAYFVCWEVIETK